MLCHVPFTCPDGLLSLQPVQALLGGVPGESHGAGGKGPTGSPCPGLAKVHPFTECEVGLPCCVPALWCSSALSVPFPVPLIPSITCRRSRAMHVTLMQQQVHVQSLPALEVT